MAVVVADTLVVVPIQAVRPYFRNPRRNDRTVDRLVELIPRVGFNVPIVLDRQNIIIKGHARWRAAVRLGMKELPAIYSDADDETNKLDRLADNKVQEFSEWENQLLTAELSSLGVDATLVALLDFNVGVAIDVTAAGASDAPAPAEDPAADDGAASDAGPDGEEEPGEPDGTPPGNGSPPPDGEIPLATAEDTEQEPAYDEVVCDSCGQRLRIEAE